MSPCGVLDSTVMGEKPSKRPEKKLANVLGAVLVR